jgi:hypothetical protein
MSQKVIQVLRLNGRELGQDATAVLCETISIPQGRNGARDALNIEAAQH